MKKSFKILALSLVLVTVIAMLASCGGPAKNPDDAIAALKDNEYTAVKSDAIAVVLRGLGVKDVETVVSGSKISDEEKGHVTIVYFKDKDAAKAAFEDIEEYANKNKEDESDWTVAQSGAMIYFGNSAGIKAAK